MLPPRRLPIKPITLSWLFWSLAAGGLTLASILFVDRPLARRVAELHLYRSMQGSPIERPIMLALAVTAVATGLTFTFLKKPLPHLIKVGLQGGLALVFSVFLVEFVLKPGFGRTHPSDFLKSGLCAFFPFYSRNWFGAFPSGHTAQATAILSVLWMHFPAWRWAYASALLLLAITLVIGEWHFLSDVIAGAYVGAAVGAVTLYLWNRSGTAKLAQ